jgi:protocatechuate 3,4-dioxygenase beta subunit
LLGYDEDMKMSNLNLLLLILIIIPVNAGALTCQPTAPDDLGPFYTPDAPLRSGVGTGYTMTVTVRSATDCSPVTDARVEFWMAGPGGEYSDSFRATMYSDASGNLRFESHFPPAYYNRPPHIHLRVSAPGFLSLVTQHYPKQGQTAVSFDIVLRPAPNKTKKNVSP